LADQLADAHAAGIDDSLADGDLLVNDGQNGLSRFGLGGIELKRHAPIRLGVQRVPWYEERPAVAQNNFYATLSVRRRGGVNGSAKAIGAGHFDGSGLLHAARPRVGE
jgi:hypothetical protein